MRVEKRKIKFHNTYIIEKSMFSFFYDALVGEVKTQTY